MTRFSRVRWAAPMIGLALLLPVLPTTAATSAASAQANIDVSPNAFVGGQRVTISGNIGRDGVRTVRLIGSMGRPGDSWTRHARTTTDANGHFSFQVTAPSMFGILRRVVASGGLQTPILELNAKSQDIVLTTSRTPVAGRQFEIVANTTPTLRGRPDLPPPIFVDRVLTLQRRVGTGWTSLATTTTDYNGEGRFPVTVGNPGVIDYRVRQENYFRNGHEIGWFPSFPTRIRIADASARTAVSQRVTAAGSARSADADSSDAAREVFTSWRSGVPATPASQAFGWNPAVFDFAWEHGESLTSPPARGTLPQGRWADGATGYGRAAKHNGGLMLDSKRHNAAGPGDRGSTWVTLRDNPRAYGRWEVRVRLKSLETRARDYRTKIELVPDRPGQYRCGGQNITIANLAAHSRVMSFGAKSVKASRQWTGKRRVGAIEGVSLTVAVEVSKRHITWFHNGRVIGTVRNSAAVSDVPLTLRLTLQGRGDREMNRTMAIFDWMRGFSLKHGRLAKGGNRLTVNNFRGGC